MSRPTVRNFRLSLELDDEILEVQKQKKHNSYTQTLLHLIQIGLWGHKNLKKFEANPELLEKIHAEWEEKVKKLTEIEGCQDELAKLDDKYMKFLKDMFAIEEESRETRKKQALENQREKERQERIKMRNMELERRKKDF
jgi:hypothetical protein